MKFKLEMDLDGAAFRRDGDPDYPEDQADGMAVAAILNRIADQIQDYTLKAGTPPDIIRDYNGNIVGRWAVTES